MLPVSAGGDVCRVLKHWSGGWMRPPVRSPHKRAAVNILLPRFSHFISVMRPFTIECRLCSISTGCRCDGGGHAHTSRAALSPGTEAVVRVSAGLDCEAVSSLGSVGISVLSGTDIDRGRPRISDHGQGSLPRLWRDATRCIAGWSSLRLGEVLPSHCASLSVLTMSRTGLLGVGLSSNGSPGGTGWEPSGSMW